MDDSISIIKLKYKYATTKIDKSMTLDNIFLALFQNPNYQNLKTGWLKKPSIKNPTNIKSSNEHIKHNILSDKINKLILSDKKNFRIINTIVSVCENGFINSKLLNVHAVFDQSIKSILEKNLFVYIKVYFNDIIYLPNISLIPIKLINLTEDILDISIDNFDSPIIFTVMLNKNENGIVKNIVISPIQL